MKLEKFEEEIRETLNEAVKDAIFDDENHASVTIETDNGYIEIYVTRNEAFEVVVCHDNKKVNTTPNLKAWIENIVSEYNGRINWLEIELEALYDIDTSDEAEYRCPGITNCVCKQAAKIRKMIAELKNKNV